MARNDDKKKLIGVLALVFGLLILWNPSLLSTLVGVYLIITGLANLFG